MKKLLLVLVLLSGLRTASAACVNQGPDHRFFAKIICPLQNVFSYRTFRNPIGLNVHGNVYLGIFPPAIATNIPLGGRYLQSRFGWRFDIYPNTAPETGCWEIFPSIALNTSKTKLLWWEDKCKKPDPGGTIIAGTP